MSIRIGTTLGDIVKEVKKRGLSPKDISFSSITTCNNCGAILIGDQETYYTCECTIICEECATTSR